MALFFCYIYSKYNWNSFSSSSSFRINSKFLDSFLSSYTSCSADKSFSKRWTFCFLDVISLIIWSLYFFFSLTSSSNIFALLIWDSMSFIYISPYSCNCFFSSNCVSESFNSILAWYSFFYSLFNWISPFLKIISNFERVSNSPVSLIT